MADLVAGDVTVTIAARKRDLLPDGDVKLVQAQVAFGDGSDTYPTNGVPLPAIGTFGFLRKIDAVFVQQQVGLVFCSYDPTNHTMRMYNVAADPPVEYTGGSTAVAATTLQLLMVGY